MRIGLAQVNAFVGDLEGNVAAVAATVARAAEQGAELVVLPELAITGYPPRDLLFDEDFVAAAEDAKADLARRLKGLPPAVVGGLAKAPNRPPRHPGLFNAALVIHKGAVGAAIGKRLLPAYDVYHEPRWFLPDVARPPVECAGRRLGLLVCEDLWDEGYACHPGGDLVAEGVELLICISASPFRRGVFGERLRQAARVARLGKPLVYVNAVGATDELVFDGRSFATDARGRVLARLKGFCEDVQVVDVDLDIDLDAASAKSFDDPVEAEDRQELRQALTLGIRDFARKNRLSRAVIGVSGGVDSAVVAALAVEALGSSRVTAVHVPSRFTDPRSTVAASELATRLGVRLEIVPLEPLHKAAEETLDRSALAGAPGQVEENLQARLRMAILMAFVNRHGGFLLSASNKTELSLGYATLYGDMAGALAPIADLTKTEVYELARELGTLPDFILQRPPTAELSAGQLDPFDYESEVPRLERLVEAHQSDAALRRSEHKRWQMGVVLKVHETAFGTGRLVPISRR